MDDAAGRRTCARCGTRFTLFAYNSCFLTCWKCRTPDPAEKDGIRFTPVPKPVRAVVGGFAPSISDGMWDNVVRASEEG